MADLFSTSDDGFDEFDRAASAFPDISLDGTTDIPSNGNGNNNNNIGGGGGFSFDSFEDSSVSVPPVTITGNDEIQKFENEFPEIDVSPVPASVPVPTYNQQTLFSTPTPFAPKPQPSALASTPILTHAIGEEEPEVIKEWREKQQEEIKTRDDASKARRQETVAKAERAIDEFYEDYARKKERNIRENKDAESDYVASLQASLSSGTTWERICELIELQNSQSKTAARAGAGTTDLTRFKEVLLRLKRQGDKAPGAAGY